MKTTSTYYRLALGLAFATVVFLVLAIGALGILGEGGRPDRVYLAVLGVFAVGVAVARFRARPMSLALLATALTQVLVTVMAVVAGVPPEDASVVDIVGINAMYAALFGLSSWLFQRSTASTA